MDNHPQPSPLVSVCIASYNHARFLPACLDSVLNQTFQDLEIIVFDDGSTDNSLEILEGYQQRFPANVFIFCHTGHANMGVSATSNAAIRASRGRYIAFIGSDDIWYPEKLEKQVALLEAHPEMGMAYSRVSFINDAGENIPGDYGTNVTADPNPTGRMLLFCHTPAITVIMRRSALDDQSLFNEQITYSDWDLMIRTFARWKVGHIDEPLAYYRLHQTNLSHGNRPDIELERVMAAMQAVDQKADTVGGELAVPKNSALLALQVAFLNFCKRDEAAAEEYLRIAQERDPSLGEQLDWIKEWLESLQYSFYTPKIPNFGFWLAARRPFSNRARTNESLLHWLVKQPETRQYYVQRGLEKGFDSEDPNVVFSDLPAGLPIPADWKKAVLNELYPALLFSTYKRGDIKKARSYWWKTVTRNPGWLINRGVLSIGLRVLLR